MIERHINTLSLWFFEHLLNHREIYHFISTRVGGFSNPPYDSLNLGFHVGDNPELVLKNRERLATAMKIPLDNFLTARQVYDSNVAVITEELQGRGAFNFDTAISATDAMVTDTTSICLMVLHADCVPLLFFDLKKRSCYSN